ncbi:MAG: phosphoribosyltransferase family protein [Pyrobaculum sp.]
MSAGLFAIYSFGGEVELYPLLYYGLKAMSNRGDVASAYTLAGGVVKRVEIDLSREEERSVTGEAAVGCVYVEECCKETKWGALCKFGPEDPAPGERPAGTAYVALTREGLYVYRPPNFWHLAVGAHGFDFLIAATESSAVEVLGGEVRKSLEGGEMLKVWKYGVVSTGGSQKGPACALDYIYASRLDSKIDGVEVAEVRSKLAAALAARIKADVDIIVGIPETGVYYASWLARWLGRWCFPAFVATARGRSALLDEVKERLAVIQLKANVVESVVRERRVLVVDDSLISGLTIRQISQLLRGKAGATEVHVAVASPPLRRRCPYGVKMPPESHMAYNHLEERQVPLALEVDSLTYLDVGEVKKAVGREICTLCFYR